MGPFMIVVLESVGGSIYPQGARVLHLDPWLHLTRRFRQRGGGKTLPDPRHRKGQRVTCRSPKQDQPQALGDHRGGDSDTSGHLGRIGVPQHDATPPASVSRESMRDDKERSHDFREEERKLRTPIYFQNSWKGRVALDEKLRPTREGARQIQRH